MRGISAARTELEKCQVEIFTEVCQTELSQEVINRIDILISKGIQGLALCTFSSEAINLKIKSLCEKNIPVVTFHSDCPDSGRLTFISRDYRKSGRVAADLISKCIPRNGKVLVSVGSLEFDNHLKRFDGFQDYMKELGFDDLQISVIETYNNYRVTYQKFLDHLSKESDINAIYMANESVSGCAEAVKTSGKRDQLRIVCHGMTESIKLLLRDGDIDFTITQDAFQLGYLPLVLLLI